MKITHHPAQTEPAPTDMDGLLSRLPLTTALVVGDLMLDQYLYGRTERISPEAPVQVVEVRREESRPGGAGNVVRNLAALGCRVRVAGVIGDDPDGGLLRQMLAEQGADTSAIVVCPGRPTSRKTRILAGNQQMLRLDRESREPIDPKAAERLLAGVLDAMHGVEIVLVSDYLKGVLTDEVLAAVITAGARLGVPVIIDPKGNDYRKYRGATLLTPNSMEARIASGIHFKDEASLRQAGRLLCRELELEALLVTRGEAGMTLFRRDEREMHLPAEAREVYDVTGAGDTVLSVLGAGIARGFAIEEAARLANIAAGIVVGKLGASTVTPRELAAAVASREQPARHKILDRRTLETLMAVERERGRTIVFTNGCFDLLHVGHVRYLQRARQLGDLLVLGLNSDTSVRRLKGGKRPLINESERGHLLAALDCVDHVCIFEEDTPLALIAALKPHILVKGGDYTPDGVVGRELVESWGGRVEIIEFVDGKSTTSLIERILETYRDL